MGLTQSNSIEEKHNVAKRMLASIVDKNRYNDIYSTLDIENLILEGGGIKGIAYCGLAKALEDVGLMKKIKRFGGTSIGSFYALSFAIGMTAEEITYETINRIGNVMPNASIFTFLPNVLWKFGWNQSEKTAQLLQDFIESKLDDRLATFEQLYRKTGTELCICVTNVSKMRTEYCHPKTTPDMPLYIAVLMSMALPVVFQPVKYSRYNDGVYEYFSDGGVLLNYPIFVYDGWYLSMEPKHSFLHMVAKHDVPAFDVFNPKTLGAVLCDISEPEVDKQNINIINKRPDTKLARSRKEWIAENEGLNIRRSKVADAGKVLLHLLVNCDTNDDGLINLEEFRAVISDKELFTPAHRETLFGDKSIDMTFETLDASHDGHIEIQEIIWFIQKLGVTFMDSNRTMFNGGTILEMGDFVSNIIQSLEFATKRNTQKQQDESRTIVICTDYIKTTDFDTEIEDQTYLMKLGWLSAISHLDRHFNGHSCHC